MRLSSDCPRFLVGPCLGLGLLLAAPLLAPAQTILTNNGGILFVNSGGTLTVNGGLAQTGAALLRTTGTATVSGSVSGSAASTLDLSSGLLDVVGNIAHTGPTAGTIGTLRLSGPAPQTLALNGGTVPHLTVDKPGGTATLAQPLAVRRVLTLAGPANLALNGQPLTLLSDATGTALVVNSGTGVATGATAIAQRYLDTPNLGLGYRHYSSPVGGNTLADLATATFTPVFDPTYNTRATAHPAAGFPTVFGYDQGRLATAASPYAGFDRGWFSPATGSTVSPVPDLFVAGRGYATLLAGTELVDFTGTLHTGPYALTLLRASGSTGSEGLHLVGNPYPAPLDWSLVTPADRPGLDAALYVFESSSQYGGRYRSAVNGIGSSTYIGSGQGFFVSVALGQASATLSFRDAHRLTDYAQQVPVRRGAAETRPLVQLRLAGTGTGVADDLFVYAEAGATPGVDTEYDAAKLANPSGLNLAALVATGEALAIDGRPDFGTATRIPLQVAVPAAGSYTLSAVVLAHLAGTRAELVDNLTGTRTALVAGASYRFAMPATTAPGRFWLNLRPAAGPLATAAAALEAQVLAYPNPTPGRLTVLRPLGGPASAVLLNALGQTMRTLALPTAETTLDLTDLATGVYVLRITLAGQVLTRRVVRE